MLVLVSLLARAQAAEPEVGFRVATGLGCPTWSAGVVLQQRPFAFDLEYGQCRGQTYRSLGFAVHSPQRPLGWRIELASIEGNLTLTLSARVFLESSGLWGDLQGSLDFGAGAVFTPLGALPYLRIELGAIYTPPWRWLPLQRTLQASWAGPTCPNPTEPPASTEEALPALQRIQDRTRRAFLSAYGDLYQIRVLNLTYDQVSLSLPTLEVLGRYRVVLWNKRTGRQETYAGRGWVRLRWNGCGWGIEAYGALPAP